MNTCAGHVERMWEWSPFMVCEPQASWFCFLKWGFLDSKRVTSKRKEGRYKVQMEKDTAALVNARPEGGGANDQCMTCLIAGQMDKIYKRVASS